MASPTNQSRSMDLLIFPGGGGPGEPRVNILLFFPRLAFFFFCWDL
jgi:hypothetical protein